MKVLLADRSPIVLDRLARLLADLPCIGLVLQAHDAAEARELVCACRPDVVIIDLSLDGGSGLPLLRYIKGCDPAPFLIVLTIDSSPTYRERCLEVADACLDKTDDLDDLLEALRRCGRAAGESCPSERDSTGETPASADNAPWDTQAA